MKSNREIFNEAFFKKASYAEKRDKRLAQYTPADPKNSSSSALSGFASPAAYQVSDTNEVKKRLAGTFGVAFGNNNIKNMAARSLKTFPIIISDNVEIDTAVMLKKLLEEQYAEYINLLVSNQVVNLADYTAGDENGNIAIQALDSLDGTDFSKSRVANTAARTGEISADTLFQNIPLYNLLKENHELLESGNKIADALLEGACIVKTDEDVKQLTRFMMENANDIAILNEYNPAINTYPRNLGKPTPTDPGATNTPLTYDQQEEKRLERRYGYKMDNNASTPDEVLAYDAAVDARRGFADLDDKGQEIYTKLTTADAIIDPKRFDQAVNRTVGEILTDKDNYKIRDKFEKATFLLQSRMIAGIEYYNYLTMRLGIPVSDQARSELVRRFKIGEVRGYGKEVKSMRGKNGEILYYTDEDSAPIFTIDDEMVSAIAQNRTPVNKSLEMILSPKVKTAIGLSMTAAGAGAGAAVGAAITSSGAIAGAVGSGILGILATPFLLPVVAGALTGAAAYGIFRLSNKKKEQELKAEYEKVKTYREGWERVEILINRMEEQQADIRTSKKQPEEKKGMEYTNTFDDKNLVKQSLDDYTRVLNQIKRTVSTLSESITNNAYTTFNQMIQESYNLNRETIVETIKELSTDKEYIATILSEKPLTQTMPIKVQYVEKKPDKDVLYTPSFMARDVYAYGSTEIERRDNKDRRYNQPLIMTIRFKERFSDGKYSDNELTAVIGILGKIIRVPSDEMEYVLKESANGNTIDGIFNGSGELQNMISDMMSATKISKDVKNLPQSADIWKNLEKVATLAAANRLSGRRNGNLSNAHIIFSQKEIDDVRTETGVDYLKDVKKSVALMKRYSAFTLMIANDAGQRVYILDDQDNISWNAVPYSALTGKDTGDQLTAALAKMSRF